MHRWWAAILAGAGWLAAATACAQAPKVNYIVPLGIPAGQAIEVIVNGESLAEPAAVWTSVTPPPADLNAAAAGKPTSSIKAKIELPAAVTAGVFAVRLITGQGVTNARLLMVDDLPTIIDSSDNVSPEKARDLPTPVGVEGAVLAESRRYYKFRAAAGQRLSFEVVARRLGSPLDPFLRLLDAGGRELAQSDDDDALGADSRFVHQFATAGEYLLELGDVRYQGGATYRYRLRIGDFPLASAPFPLAVQKGWTATVEVSGTALAELPRLEASVPQTLASDRLTLRAEYPGGQGASAVTLLASSALEQVEFEPNDTPATASPLDMTGAVNGRFAADGDRDCFRLAAKKGQRMMLRGRTRSLGLKRDLYLRVLDAEGKQLAQAGQAEDDAVVDVTFPADGTYHLMAEDLLGRGGPDHVYRIEFAPYQAGFTLATDADVYNAPCGGVFQVKATAVRRGYTGPIELVLAGLPASEIAGFKLAGGVIPEGKAVATVTVTAPKSLPPGSWRSLQLVGRAKIGDKPLETPASGAAALKTALNGVQPLPAEVDGQLALGIGPVFPDFITLKAADNVVLVNKPSGTAEFKVEVARLEKFAGPVTLAAEGLPAGWEVKPVTVPTGKSEAALTLSGPPAAAEGERVFRLVASGTHQNQPGRAVLEMKLRIVKREAAPAGEQPGKKGAAP